MKIMKAISAATQPTRTTFYKTELKDAIRVLSDNSENPWLIAALNKLGWGAINFKTSLFGSKVFSKTLYICETDGSDILVNNKSVDPESALEDYDISDLGDYIQPATDEIILRYITTYEIKTPDFDKWAPELLETSGYTFTDLSSAATEFDEFSD